MCAGAALSLTVLSAASAQVDPAAAPPAAGGDQLNVSSPAFSDGAPLPQTYTCYNAREPSPPVGWTNAPRATRVFAVVLDAPERPDGVQVQWLVYNIPPRVTEFGEDTPKVERLTNGSLQGRNDLGVIGYSAPCPPPNTVYTYRFTVYALDSVLALGAGATLADFQDAAAGHMLGQGQLTATYLRPAWPWG